MTIPIHVSYALRGFARYYSSLRRELGTDPSGGYGMISDVGQSALDTIAAICQGDARHAEEWFRNQCAMAGAAIYSLHSGLNHSCDGDVEAT